VPVLLLHRVEPLILNDAGQVIGGVVSVNDPAVVIATAQANVDTSSPDPRAT